VDFTRKNAPGKKHSINLGQGWSPSGKPFLPPGDVRRNSSCRCPGASRKARSVVFGEPWTDVYCKAAAGAYYGEAGAWLKKSDPLYCPQSGNLHSDRLTTGFDVYQYADFDGPGRPGVHRTRPERGRTRQRGICFIKNMLKAGGIRTTAYSGCTAGPAIIGHGDGPAPRRFTRPGVARDETGVIDSDRGACRPAKVSGVIHPCALTRLRRTGQPAR